jgi:hypothetical protein
MTTPAYEKLGAFYLGREYDLTRAATNPISPRMPCVSA